ncbi:BED zinc finger [Carex littledalei]|uniref:BED zinc finger n=1 Tax=Carex littledalei TaxID=544730 RepID=A0A833R9H1_9POAL|nr:BED zinc finger [Carex littledalei]
MDHTSVEIEEPINANGKRRKLSDVWTHFEEVEISSKTSDGILQKVVKIKCKDCNQYFTKSKCGTTSTLKRHIEARHPHLQQVSSQNEDMARAEVSETDKTAKIGGTRKISDVWAQFEEVGVTEKKQKGLNFKVSSQNEDTVRAEVSETDKTAKMGETRRSDVWTQFEEVVVTEKKPKGLNFKVKKLKCKKCRKLFTMPKDGSTSTLKRHMEETCAIRNGQKSLLDYCIKS